MNLIILTASIIALVIACSVFIYFDRSSYKTNLINQSKVLTNIISTNCYAAILFDDANDAEDILSALSNEKNVLSAGIYKNNGNLFAEYLKPGLNSIHQSIEPFATEKIQFDENIMKVMQPIMIESEHLGHIIINFSLDEMKHRTDEYIGIILIVVVACFIVVIGVTNQLQKVITTPILHLAEIVGLVSQTKDYTLRAERLSRDETGFLVDQFNEMLLEINERDYELAQAKSQLEQRVEERTAQLAQSKADLEKRYQELELADNKIKASLREKEVMLKEIHHRVKNNLQVISSLLSLQSNHIDDPYALTMFKESQNRVRSMALVHQKLYQSVDLSNIDFGDYINGLTTELYRSYAIDPLDIQFRLMSEKIQLPIDLAVPCGLVVNELISNILKHAFPAGFKEEKQIEISIQPYENDGMEVKISDNGIGMPEDFHYKKTDSLGFKLVYILVEDQLRGTIDWTSDNGTTFTIRFKKHI